MTIVLFNISASAFSERRGRRQESLGVGRSTGSLTPARRGAHPQGSYGARTADQPR
jgi:hypothetical protein